MSNLQNGESHDPPFMASSKTGNGKWGNGERGMRNGEQEISKMGNL